METIKIEVEFRVGTLEEIGLGGLHVNWVSVNRTLSDGNGGTEEIEYELTAGAGVGNPLLDASARVGGKSLYARASVTGLCADLFDELTARLRPAPELCPAGCGCRMNVNEGDPLHPDARECGCEGPCNMECLENGYPDAPSFRAIMPRAGDDD